MTHPDIAQALAAARRDDLLRAAAGRGTRVITRNRRRDRNRILAWLEGQRLGHRRLSGPRTASCVAVTR